MLIRARRYQLAVLLALLCWWAPLAAQESGQYRSRIQLDPLGELGKGSEMSVAELEASIDSIKEPYAKSSASRFLARHSVQQGDYAAAIDYYRQALLARGLSDVANREMLRELAQVYLLNEDYREAAITLQRALDIKLQAEPGDFLLLAQAQYRLGDYVAVVAALDGIEANGLSLDVRQLRQALALYYRVGAYQQSELILQRLLALEPGQPSHWHQLAGVYLQQNKRRAALDQLTLALEKRVPFTAAELQLLIDLHAVTGNPYTAATLLQEAMAEGGVPASAANQRKLFELWLQARERNRAKTALQRAARGSGDTELFLYLAQLQMEDQQWQAMLTTLLGACEQRLQDRHVSRANLLLGVSLFKLGRDEEARRAFINATLVGGANAQAGEWLEFMQAAAPSPEEARLVRGPCVGSEGKQGSLQKQKVPAQPVAEPAASSAAEQIAIAQPAIKTVSGARFFYSAHSEDLADLLPDIQALAVRLNLSLVKAGGTADGPLTLLVLPGEDLRLALPARGAPQARGRYRLHNAPQFRCAWLRLEQAEADPVAAVTSLQEQVLAAGYSLSGEMRLVFAGGGTPSVEIQLGIE